MEKNGYSAADLPKWGSVTVYGLDADDVKSPLTVDGQDMQDKASFDEDTKVTDKLCDVAGVYLNLTQPHKSYSWFLGNE